MPLSAGLDIVKLEGLVFHPLLEEPMVVALPEGHALARGPGRSCTSVEESCPTRHSLLTADTGALGGVRDVVFAACHAAGFSPRVGQEAPNVIATLPLVAAGIGISIVPASLQHMNIRGVAFRRADG